MPTSKASLAAAFANDIGRAWRESVRLSDHSSFKIGGPADYFFSAATEVELIAAVKFAREQSLPFFILGGGYNILFADEGFRGLIIKNSIADISRSDRGNIRIASGIRLAEVIDFCVRHELGGLEFLAGIPGTVGGAVYGNAGAFDHAIGEYVVTGKLLDSAGMLRDVPQEYFSFAYRWSSLKKSRDVLLQVILRCKPENREVIARKTEQILQLRKVKHPGPDTACAGSYFKNPQNSSGNKIAAALLLDQIGAKQLMVGGAAVYSRHANFIINQGGATSQDVRQLAELLKKRVKNSTGIQLDEEVIFLPASG